MTLAEHRRRYPGETTLSTLLAKLDNAYVWARHYRRYGYSELQAQANDAYDSTLLEILAWQRVEGTP